MPNVTLAWDIYFEFKTGVDKSSGTLFHGFSEFDEIVISITNGLEIMVELNSQHFLTFQSLTPLDDNKWHSVLFECNIMEMTLYVDNKNSTQITPQKAIRQYRPLILNSAVIGAMRNSTNGYLGCLRTLWVNGFKLNLVETKNQLKGSEGIKFGGCNGACDTLPCKHGGFCTEMYQNFSCGCSKSAYTGPTCQEDVSINFNGSSIQTNLSLLEMNDDITVQFSFVALYDDYEESATLLTLSTEIDTEIQIELHPSGGLTIDITDEESDGLNFDDLDMYSLHEIGIKTFDKGKQFMVKLDHHDAKSIVLQNVTLDGQLWRIAEFGTDFNGCMSNLIINNEIAPFKGILDSFSGSCRASKLTRDADDEDYISTTTTEVNEDHETTTFFNETLETSTNQDVADKYDNENEIEGEEEYSFLMWIYIFIVLVILTIAYFVKKYIKRHTGVYKTKEDAGEIDAEDADTAVLHSKTGHMVEKKQEWFF